jgi:hypothetical protein
MKLFKRHIRNRCCARGALEKNQRNRLEKRTEVEGLLKRIFLGNGKMHRVIFRHKYKIVLCIFQKNL